MCSYCATPLNKLTRRVPSISQRTKQHVFVKCDFSDVQGNTLKRHTSHYVEAGNRRMLTFLKYIDLKKAPVTALKETRTREHIDSSLFMTMAPAAATTTNTKQ